MEGADFRDDLAASVREARRGIHRAIDPQLPRRLHSVPVDFAHHALDRTPLDDVEIRAVHHRRGHRRQRQILDTDQAEFALNRRPLDHVAQFADVAGPPRVLPSCAPIVESSHRVRKRNVDDVLGHEPDLEFVGTDDVAHDQVVGAVVAVFGRQLRHRARFFEDDLVRV